MPATRVPGIDARDGRPFGRYDQGRSAEAARTPQYLHSLTSADSNRVPTVHTLPYAAHQPTATRRLPLSEYELHFQ